jgi:hypothetical protein
MTMAAAVAFGAADPGRRAAGLGPSLFRGGGFDQKKTPLVHPVVFLSHPLDHSLSHIHRIESHHTFLLLGEPFYS